MRILEAVNPRRPLIQSIDTAFALRAAKALCCFRRLQLRLRLPILPDFRLFFVCNCTVQSRGGASDRFDLRYTYEYTTIQNCYVVLCCIVNGSVAAVGPECAVQYIRVESTRWYKSCNSDHMCCVETRMEWAHRTPRAASEVLFGDADKWSNSLCALSLFHSLSLSFLERRARHSGIPERETSGASKSLHQSADCRAMMSFRVLRSPPL